MTVQFAFALWLLVSLPVSVVVGALLGCGEQDIVVPAELLAVECQTLKIGA